MDPNERVLCLPTESVDSLFHQVDAMGSGYIRTVDAMEPHVRDMLLARGHEYRPRAAVEDDESLQQVATYMLIECGDRVFAYRRGRSGDDRIRGKLSVGVGGHVVPFESPDSFDMWTVIDATAWRELNEEIRLLVPPREIRRIGLVRDRSDAIGRVHVGVVYRCVLPVPEIAIRETSALRSGRFMSLDELTNVPPAEIEGWSRILIFNS